MDEEVDIKIVVVGTSGVGKTALAQRFTTNRWHPHSSATVGASFVLKRETIRNRAVALHIWDTAGQERFRSMGSLYFRGALAAVLVYDVTSRESFDMLSSWLADLRRHAEPNVVLAVAANKVDEARHAVSEQEGAKFAHGIGARWLATSAKSGEGVQDLFMGVARRAVVELEAAGTAWPRERLALREGGDGAAKAKGCC